MRGFCLGQGRFFACVCILMFAGPGFAETKYDAAAVATGMNVSTDHELGEHLVAVMGVNKYETMKTEDAANPMNGASGDCFGFIEIRDEEWSGEGYCKLTDADGELFITHWEPNGPPLDYSWTLIGGNGKWVGSSGGGKITQTMDDKMEAFESVFSGEITLK
jgi:hypothetical protein